MQWAYSASTEVGDLKIFNKKGKWVLLEATENGCIELRSGTYKEMKHLEQTYRNATDSLYGHIEKFRSGERRDTWDLFNSKNRGYDDRNGEQNGSQGFQTDSERDNEHLRSGDKGESVKRQDRVTPEHDTEYLELAKNPEKNEARLREMVDEASEKAMPNSVIRDGNGKLLTVYHGTPSGEFTVFDKSKGSVEGDFGSGFYFTDNDTDVTNNYEGGGPDFENKVARRAEQIEQEEDIDYDEAEKRAREELFKGSHKFEVYLNIENPAIVGETTLFDSESYLEEYDEADFEDYDEYIAEVEQLVSDDIEKIIWDIERSIDIYSTDGLASILFKAYYDGGIGVEELKSKINELYLEDNEGNIVGNEVTRQIIESLGYDGIIDNTVSTKFKNMGMEEGTTHYIVFKPNQIKSADPVTYDDNGNVIPLPERFNEVNDDIRYSDRSYWVPNMPKADLEQIKMIAKSELPKADKYIDNITKWLYNTKNGKNYFAIYSTEDENDPTILFASLNKQAIMDRDLVGIYIDMLNDTGVTDDEQSEIGQSKIEQSGTFDEIFDRVKRTNVLRSVYSGEPLGRRADNGDVSVHSKTSSSRPSRALLNCLRDCYERRNPKRLNNITKNQDRQYQPSFEDLGIDYKEENEHLKADVDRLKEMLKLQRTVTHGKALAKSTYESVAKKLLHNFGMKRVTDNQLLKEFINRLDSFYSYIINEDDLVWKDMFDKSMEIARWLDSTPPENINRTGDASGSCKSAV